MSVWVLHQSLTPEEEGRIHERPGVFLPFDNIPDLSLVSSQSHMRELLQKVHPDSPPESILLMLDRLWQQYNGLQVDDTVAVPLPHKKAVAIARVNGRYQYQAGKDGSDVHMIPVEWYPVMAPLSSFGKFRRIFEGTQRMVEVGDKEARIKIHDKLPHKFNRFARWKWLVLILVALQAMGFILGMLR